MTRHVTWLIRYPIVICNFAMDVKRQSLKYSIVYI